MFRVLSIVKHETKNNKKVEKERTRIVTYLRGLRGHHIKGVKIMSWGVEI